MSKTRECSLLELSSGVLNVVQKNLPQNELVLFCYETQLPPGRDKTVYYQSGVVTKKWLLVVNITHTNGKYWGGGSTCLMKLSEIGSIIENENYNGQGSLTIRSQGCPQKVAQLDFDSKYLCYKIQETIQEASRDNYEAPQKEYPNESCENSQKSKSSQININGNVSGSTIIIGNENEIK